MYGVRARMRSRCSIPVMRPSRTTGPDGVFTGSLSGPVFGSYASLDLSLGLASPPGGVGGDPEVKRRVIASTNPTWWKAH
jgi:hypothetical protein